ncbi:XRE family transcriptional regulator [Alteromonas profundi]|uniref:helix-turn-helix domain-containing protein n=1 Tax=Alteromonas profundi TaxID=2696062 RepID=UPI0031B5C4FE
MSSEGEGRIFAQSIAVHLKTLRKQKTLSLDKVAQLTGVSKAMLGQIERQESSPTIATLWKIATGLEVSFSSFLQNSQEDKASLSKGAIHDPNMQASTLFPFDAQKGFEVFEITLSSFHQQYSTAHLKGVTEHIHVLEGRLAILEGEKWRDVEIGQQCVINADQPHGYQDKAGKTRFIAIIHYPLI